MLMLNMHKTMGSELFKIEINEVLLYFKDAWSLDLGVDSRVLTKMGEIRSYINMK